ncbi:MAG TPA: 16S rRNA (guanine(966)-N(2))-methyltransferase RsmD [Patescibacteria group bacterium]|nr:16S rRNA (guanine(966)-N(2))-methyltransferase RsmD [Patescibacteria group bacterium]
MRIIAGRLGGRQFNSPNGHRTHPMSDKVRGALFNALGDIAGLTVLDAFAGSGALSFEAISRGAATALAIDVDRQAAASIKQNSKSLNLGSRVKVIQANTSSWLETNPNARFDLIFCDPPYDQLQEKLIEKLASCLKPEGLLILSWPGKARLPSLESLSLIDQKNYGDTQLAFYRPSELE